MYFFICRNLPLAFLGAVAQENKSTPGGQLVTNKEHRAGQRTSNSLPQSSENHTLQFSSTIMRRDMQFKDQSFLVDRSWREIWQALSSHNKQLSGNTYSFRSPESLTPLRPHWPWVKPSFSLHPPPTRHNRTHRAAGAPGASSPSWELGEMKCLSHWC